MYIAQRGVKILAHPRPIQTHLALLRSQKSLFFSPQLY
jgi:hypothetical protein